jgi:4'-phosphopantetheinyl transferase EntD
LNCRLLRREKPFFTAAWVHRAVFGYDDVHGRRDDLMNWPQYTSLQSMLQEIAPRRVLIGHKIIAEGDEQALQAEESSAFAGSVVKVRRASGAARMVARELMRRMDVAPQPVIKAVGGMPTWPDGMVGSLAHDATVAVAALAGRDDYLSIGIDIEPAEPLDPDLLDMVATPGERAVIQEGIRKTIPTAPLHGRLLFAIKEAVYKAAYPLDRVFLDHHDVEVDFVARTAAISGQRTVRFTFGQSSHIAVLAFIPATQAEPER